MKVYVERDRLKQFRNARIEIDDVTELVNLSLAVITAVKQEEATIHAIEELDDELLSAELANAKSRLNAFKKLSDELSVRSEIPMA